MYEGLLKTKLFPPPARSNHVPRGALVDRFDHYRKLGVSCVIVSAPAGFGKTTLMVDCARASQASFAWLALDENDNDLLRFWRYVDAALATVDPRIGAGLRPELFAVQVPVIERIITGMINDISLLEKDLILVLDDYHAIELPVIHQSVNFLLDHLPERMNLVVITRSDPPLNLARRRARGQLLEFRAADLRFTLEETAAFLNLVMQLGLSAEDIAALGQHTEGWIAGLNLAAISLKNTDDPHSFIAAFEGDDRYIADYLLEEVLRYQPEELQQFMLKTSVLNRLSAALCNKVTGRGDSQEVLNALERANLFIIPLDTHREWFRYHHLFASLLQRRLIETVGDAAVVALRRLASQWHAEQGNLVEAVELAISGGDSELAVAIIEASEQALFTASGIDILRQWAERLPAEVIARHRKINLMAAWASHATGYLQLTERLVRILEESVGVTAAEFLAGAAAGKELAPLDRSALLEAAAVLTRMAVDALNLQEAVRLGGLLIPFLTSVPSQDSAFNKLQNLYGPVVFSIGLAQELMGNLPEAARLFAEAENQARQHQNAHILALAICHSGWIQELMDQPEQAEATYQRALSVAKTFPPFSSPFWGMADIQLGRLAVERGDLSAAEAHLQAGVALGKIANSWDCLLPGMVCQARIEADRGNWRRAESILEELENRTASFKRLVQPTIQAERALLQFKQGNHQAAGQLAAGFPLSPPAVNRLQWALNAITIAQVWWALDRRAEASALLEQALSEARAFGSPWVARKAQQAAQASLTAKRMTVTHPDLVEPLTEREFEVLRLLASGLSLAEIAKKLFISPNTLKAHAQNIYGKLNVHNRMEAVNKARELSLL